MTGTYSSPRNRAWLLPMVAYTLITIAATHPLWLHLASAVPSDIGDPLLNTWILAWDVRALTIHPLGLFDANMFFPLPNTLAYSEHLLGTALTMLPVLLITGEPVIAYNVAFLASFILGGWGAYLLARRHLRSGWAAFLVGLAFAYAPYRLTAFSHLQLLTLQWLPLSLLCLEYMVPSAPGQRSGTRSGLHLAPTLAFIILLWLQIISSWHLAVFTSFTIAIYTIGWLGRLHHSQRPSALFRLAVALFAVGVMTWPLVPPYLDTMKQLQSARPIEISAGFGAHLADYAAAPPWNKAFGSLTAPLAVRPGFTEENFMFVGITSLILVVAGLWSVLKQRRKNRQDLAIATTWLCIGLSAWVLSWGPYAHIGKQTFPLLYLLLAKISPVFGLIRVPPRWIIAAGLPIAILAGYGSRFVLDTCSQCEEQVPIFPGRRYIFQSGPFRRSVISVLLGAALVLESWSVPLPLAEVGPMNSMAPVYRWLAAQPGDFGIIEWPIHVAPRPEYPETKRLYASTLHWKSLVNGYSGFTPERQTILDTELSNFPDERALQALRDLGRQGVRYLVIHTQEQGFDQIDWEDAGHWVLERSVTTLPVFKGNGDIVYEINPWGNDWVAAPETVTDEVWRNRAPHLVSASWQYGLVCMAYSGTVAQENVGYVDLFWRRTAPFPRDVSVFVHLLDPGGNIVAQGDGPMGGGHFPTLDWSSSEVMQDRHVLIPVESSDLVTGTQLRIGLYYPETGERIPVLGEEGNVLGDYALLPWPPGSQR